MNDVDSWRITAILLGSIAIVIFFVQRTKYMFLDPAFEVAIFEFPAILAVLIYFVISRRTGKGIG